MQVKSISTKKADNPKPHFRPQSLQDFVGQDHIKKILTTAIHSASTNAHTLGHILLSGSSGYGKTTLAQIVAQNMWVNIKIITGYAISKPSEMISIFHTLNPGDILFIDEIHRLRPALEEVLYIAMEDFVIDMVMPEWGNVRIPIQPFTLIGATTQSESLSTPLKNRFVYSFHFTDYETEHKKQIIERYLKHYGIDYDPSVLDSIEQKTDSVPRLLHTLAIQIRDYLIHLDVPMRLDAARRAHFVERSNLHDGGLTDLHQKYLTLLRDAETTLGLKTIALKLGINEKAVEQDIEPLLLKNNLIQKTSKGRTLNNPEE